MPQVRQRALAVAWEGVQALLRAAGSLPPEDLGICPKGGTGQCPSALFAFLWLAQKLHVRCLPLLNLVGKPDMQARHWLPVFR